MCRFSVLDVADLEDASIRVAEYAFTMKPYSHILVTGGAGFIGSHLVDALIGTGYRVRVLDNLDPQIHLTRTLPPYFHRQAEFLHGDVTNKTDWMRALDGIDAVFHFASAVGVGQSMYEIEKYVKVNSLGTALLLDILANTRRRIRKLVVAASMSSYGEGVHQCDVCGVVRPPLRSEKQVKSGDFSVYCPTCGKPVRSLATGEDAKQNSNSIYAIGKKEQEEMVLTVGKSYTIPAVSLRYFNVYGPRQSLSNPYNGVAAIFVSRVKNNKSPVINEDGEQTRDFVHIRDVTRANILALEHDASSYEAFNVGSGVPISIKAVAEIIIKKMKKNLSPDISRKIRKLDVRHCFADISKISRVLGWKPTVSFSEGISDVILWGKNEEAVDSVDFAMQELEKRGLR